MKYFSGFCLQGEERFFEEYVVQSDYTVVGFSYGAQKAFEYVYNTDTRIDRLILISPAFFQNHTKSFIKTQLRYFKADEEAYKKAFLENVSYPSKISLEAYLTEGSYEALETLLTYVWDKEKIKSLLKRGITLEVFLGAEDKIVDTTKSQEFFGSLVPIYLFKEKGHLLR